MTLEPEDPASTRYLLLDLKCVEPHQGRPRTWISGSVAAHVERQSVQAAMESVSSWASLRGGCNAAFGFVHSGSTNGLDDLPAGCQDRAMFAWDGLKEFMPIFAARTFLLSSCQSDDTEESS